MLRTVVTCVVLAAALLSAVPAQSHHSNVAYEVTAHLGPCPAGASTPERATLCWSEL
jgi:hypothetical protein